VGRSLKNARIGVMGYAYLENSDDTRNSPSAALVEQLQDAGADIAIHDPWVAEYSGDLLERLAGCDAAVLMVAHNAYKAVHLSALSQVLRTPVMIDGRRLYNLEQAQAAGLRYRAIGQGN
jgi:UDP-N-acetyl-D-mannosaminuronic acid dehydrogenase